MFKIILTKSLEELKMQTTTLLWLALNNENSEAGERSSLDCSHRLKSEEKISDVLSIL